MDNSPMTKNELQAICKKYLFKPSLKENSEIVEICCNFFRLALVNQQRVPAIDESDGYAKVIMQMVLSKGLHLNSLANGINLFTRKPLVPIIDPTVLAVLIRNIFETVGMFNLIYRSTSNNGEKQLIYNLWHIAGLSYRQRFEVIATTDENKRKAKDEKKAIKTLVEEIKNSGLFKSLDAKNQDKIRLRIKQKEYLIRFDSTKVIFLAWHDLIKNMGIKETLFSEMYTFFSLYSHPSFISVLQFGQMFDPKEDSYLNLATLNLRFGAYFICTFISDYIYLFPQFKEYFEKLPLQEQIIINGINRIIRGPEFVINDALDVLD